MPQKPSTADPVKTNARASHEDSGARDPRADGGALLDPADDFIARHLGPGDAEIAAMLATLGYDSLDALTDATIPTSIRLAQALDLGPPRGEKELLDELRGIAARNEVFRSCIGMGYHGTITPPVIQRNILESPGWYTQYTPYQAEIAQGRLEALLNFQTMVADLTGLPLANASLLDEATAAAEAMTMCLRIAGRDRAWFVSAACHPQTIEVVRTRAGSLGVEIVVGDEREIDSVRASDAHGSESAGFCGVLLQYPTTDGRIIDYSDVIERAHAHGALIVMATDLLACTLIKPPGEFSADIAVGSSQRFGVPMGFGGPHAAFLATKEEHARKMPGRIIGVSKDAHGNPALRMAIQTREQHIRRDRATSNICTAQVLLAVMAGMYAVYHGPEGLKKIARRVHGFAVILARKLKQMGWQVDAGPFFDTIVVRFPGAEGPSIARRAVDYVQRRRLNLRLFDDSQAVGVALDETTTLDDVAQIITAFRECAVSGTRALATVAQTSAEMLVESWDEKEAEFSDPFARTSDFLAHPVFNTYHSETEMLRYIKKLELRDLSLAQSMIPLGSCTMKLNATSEMLPVTWPEFADLHPYAPEDQTAGYQQLLGDLERWLCEMTGFAACSLQPNAGSQGEYAGLLAIRAHHDARGDHQRVDCLIPTSAHGTNPASAVVAGMQVVPVECDDDGNIDLNDLRAKAENRRDTLAAFMITYPSTHGVFEESIREMCDIIHTHGGLVYLDGANMNAQIGLCRPADFGADVCHLNLHKTFCIPHGGGGPGVGPICVIEALRPFLPGDLLNRQSSIVNRQSSIVDRQSSIVDRQSRVGPVSAAPFGSPSILPISWVYIALMGEQGLRRASQVAILNANYMAKRLADHYDVLFTGRNGTVAHEFIIDCRPFKKSAGIEIDDMAKRLMDYGFHAPTMSWPVPGTLMIEPTESESKAELDRYCEALIAIRGEIREIEEGAADRHDNVLKNAPHTMVAVSADEWTHPYPREQAAYPAPWLRDHKFWPHVGRVDNPYGDRNLMCTCPTASEFG